MAADLEFGGPGPVASISDRFPLVVGSRVFFDPERDWTLESVLDDSHDVPGCSLTAPEKHWLNAWDAFVQIMQPAVDDRHLPGHPIWADAWLDFPEMKRIDWSSPKRPQVPRRVTTPAIDADLPAWKQSHLKKNYDLFARHHEVIIEWAHYWRIYTEAFPPSRRKLEWQAQDAKSLWDTFMHLRPSGIRAKKATYAPALIGITQTAIVGPRGRRLSPRETARLQGLPDSFTFVDQPAVATYKQMGNGVNVGAVWHVMREHVGRDRALLEASPEGRAVVAAVTAAPLSPSAILASHTPRGPLIGVGNARAAPAPSAAATGPDRPFFLPAGTPGEAIERIFSLTGASDIGTRGEKRAVVALRDALGLNVPTGYTSDIMGAAIAESLGVEWLPNRYLDHHTVTLDGLNALLEGATDAYAQGSLQRLEEMRPALLKGPEWATFSPARSKIEAVNRISMLTGSGPERLGPGGKEHKRVLVNLVNGMRVSVPITTKHSTAEALAREFNTPWSDVCVSTQGTITLIGLNVLLAGAERRLGRLGVDRALLFGTPEEEGSALAAALVDGFTPTRFDDGSEKVFWSGHSAVKWLADNQTGQANQMEWPGFYWEFRARTILGRRFAPNPHPPRSKYGPEPFDYSLNFVWDLKAHTEAWRDPNTQTVSAGQSSTPLNDAISMDLCINEQGLGFLMAGGIAVEDTGEKFKRWHDTFKGREAAPSNSGRSRRRKAAFDLLHVDAYWFADTQALDAAKAAGLVTGFNQGRQAPVEVGAIGTSRRPKYNLSNRAAGTTLHLVRYDYPRKGPTG